MQALSCPLPCGQRAISLSQSLKTRLKDSLEYLIELNKDALGNYHAAWQAAVENIPQDRKIPSFYYSLNSILTQETMAGNVADIASYITYLPKYNIHDKQLYFLNFSEEGSDKVRNSLQKKFILFDLDTNTNIHSADKTSFEQIKHLVNQALELIAAIDLESYQEILSMVGEVMVLKADGLKAGSSFDMFGLIYLNANNAKKSLLNMVDLIIHEAAHYYLYSLSIDDPLVLNDYQETYYSPIRKAHRPIVGIYHAAFVLFRVLRFLSLLTMTRKKTAENPGYSLQNEKKYEAEEKEIAELYAQYSKVVIESIETVLKFGKLTELGESLIRETEQAFMRLSSIK